MPLNDAETAKKEFTAAVLHWFDSVPDGSHDWAEALLMAALDEAGGDSMKALRMAQKEFLASPTPPEPGG